MKNKIFIAITMLISICFALPFNNAKALTVNGERIDWNNKMTEGKDIAYWIADDCLYFESIPNAAQKVMYPDSGSNRLVLSYTENNPHSKMDFYKVNDTGTDTVAYTTSHRKNANGEYYTMPTYEKDSYDWVYVKITLNDYYMQPKSPSGRVTTIVHEMLHGYGLKDLYNTANIGSIMYGRSNRTATGVTTDANTVLNNKY